MSLKTFFLLIFAGSLYAFGFPNIISSSLLITPIISLTLFFGILFKEHRFKRLVLMTLVFSLGFNLTGYYWIANTIQEFGGIPYPLAILINALFSLIVMPYLWPVVTMIYFLNKKRALIINSGLKTFSLAIIFTLFEYYTPQQFDSFLGNPWIVFSKYLSFASIGGVSIYSFFSFLLIF